MMKGYQIFKIDKGSLDEFVEIWSKLYNYPAKCLYRDNIDKILTKESLYNLYKWKNGRGLSAKNKESFNTKIASKLKLINGWKLSRNKIPFDLIHRNFQEVSAIWLIFLAHIIKPKTYPIFDQHVYRAYYYLLNKEVKEIPAESKKLKAYTEEYLIFCQDIRKTQDLKKLDEALWSFGKFLRQYSKVIS